MLTGPIRNQIDAIWNAQKVIGVISRLNEAAAA